MAHFRNGRQPTGHHLQTIILINMIDAPELRGWPLLGVAPSLHRDALGFFRQALNQHGPRVRFTCLGQRVLLLADPQDAETVLIADRESYGRSAEIHNLRPIFGEGLLTSEGERWRKQRKQIQPGFQHDRILRYADFMLSSMTARISGWDISQAIDVQPEMAGFTRDVICKAVFGEDYDIDVETVARCVSVVFGDLRSEILYLPLWRKLPLSRSRRWNWAVRELNAAVANLIVKRRKSGEDRSDLLGMLLSASNDAGETAMSDQWVHDEILTMFLAGQETSALALTWTIYMLARNLEVQEIAAAEAQRVKGNGSLQAHNYRDLPYSQAVVQEVMRLRPPVWSMGREAYLDLYLPNAS
jgi:cytochrome P450